MKSETVPFDSRYIPFVQQPYCCVPASIQAVLYKNNLPLVSQEEIGTALGLVVPPDAKDAFYNVEVHEKPVVSSGFGTRVQEPAYDIPSLIRAQKWPFKYTAQYATMLSDRVALATELKKIEDQNNDALVCFQNDHGTGHVCVFDRILNGTIRLIDPSPMAPKWRSMPIDELFNRIQTHGDGNGGGLWLFNHV